jgi:hypothetical protein
VKAKSMDQRSDSLADIAVGCVIEISRAVAKFHDDWKRNLVIDQKQVFLVELYQVGNRWNGRTSWIYDYKSEV